MKVMNIDLGSAVIYLATAGLIISVLAIWTKSNLIFYFAYFGSSTVITYGMAWLTTLGASFVVGGSVWANIVVSVVRLFL